MTGDLLTNGLLQSPPPPARVDMKINYFPNDYNKKKFPAWKKPAFALNKMADRLVLITIYFLGLSSYQNSKRAMDPLSRAEPMAKY